MKLLANIESFLQTNRKIDARKLFKQCKECFLRIHMLDKSLAARSEYFLKYLNCLKIVMKVSYLFILAIILLKFKVDTLAISHPSFVLSASRLMQLTYEIENRYLGLSISSILHFHLLRLYSHAMILVYQLRLHSLFGNMRNPQSNEINLRPLDLNQTIKSFLTRIDTVEKYVFKSKESILLSILLSTFRKFSNFKIDPPAAITHWKKSMTFNTIEEVLFSSFSKELLVYIFSSILFRFLK